MLASLRLSFMAAMRTQADFDLALLCTAA